jgi:hypothetical protein
MGHHPRVISPSRADFLIPRPYAGECTSIILRLG